MSSRSLPPTWAATRVTEGQVEAVGYLVRSIAAKIAADGAEIERVSYTGLAPRNRQLGTSLSSVSSSREGNKTLRRVAGCGEEHGKAPLPGP